MPDYNQHSLKDAIGQLLKLYGLDDELLAQGIVKQWENLFGKMIAKHTTDIVIRQQKLFITCDSAALRNELLMQKSVMIQKVNELAGKELINEIILK